MNEITQNLLSTFNDRAIITPTGLFACWFMGLVAVVSAIIVGEMRSARRDDDEDENHF